MDDLLTLKELSEYLKIAEKTLYGYARTGRVPGIRIGSAWRFRRSDIEEWLEEQRQLTESAYQEDKMASGPKRGSRRREGAPA